MADLRIRQRNLSHPVGRGVIFLLLICFYTCFPIFADYFWVQSSIQPPPPPRSVWYGVELESTSVRVYFQLYSGIRAGAGEWRNGFNPPPTDFFCADFSYDFWFKLLSSFPEWDTMFIMMHILAWTFYGFNLSFSKYFVSEQRKIMKPQNVTS